MDQNFSLVACALYCSALTPHILMSMYLLVEFMLLAFTHMPGESCHWNHNRSLLSCSCASTIIVTPFVLLTLSLTLSTDLNFTLVV